MLQFCYTFFLLILPCFVPSLITCLAALIVPALLPCPVLLYPCLIPVQRLPLQLLIVFDHQNTTKTGIRRYIMLASRYRALPSSTFGYRLLSPTTQLQLRYHSVIVYYARLPLSCPAIAPSSCYFVLIPAMIRLFSSMFRAN